MYYMLFESPPRKKNQHGRTTDETWMCGMSQDRNAKLK